MSTALRLSPPPADPTLVLATDLDGTFLGGSPADRRVLYETVERSRHTCCLVFVTGRDLPHIERLCAEPGFPRPDYVVGDVGTTVVDGRTGAPIEAVQGWISERWSDAGERVRALLDGVPGLSLQPTPFERRVSYDYDPRRFDPVWVSRIEEAGFDCLISADRFLDVLPRGVSKGPTLRRLLSALGLAEDRVLVAGDTLNDHSLFTQGLRGVVVSNAEPGLRARTEGLPDIYHAGAPGAAGITEAIAHFGLWER